MDLHSISKIGCRKKLVENLEQIQQTVQKENKKIIELSLQQDSAIREQMENLATSEAAQELQQQNMLQLQMDYESIWSKYQEELQKRLEIINKLDYSRKTCDELEKSAQKCTAQSDRANADLDCLMKVYAAADATVCSLKQQYVTIMEQAKSRINEKSDELKEKSEQLEKLNHKYHYSQAQLHMLQSQLEAARSNHNELSASAEDSKNKLEAATKEYKLLLNLFTEQLESYKQRVVGDGFKLGQITLELFKTNEESKNKNIIIEKLQTEIRTLSETLSETQNGFQNYREETEEKLKSLAETIEVKCNEIEVHSSAATQANKELQLLTASLEERGRELEVKTSALIEEKEARAKIESDLVNQKRKFENEVDTLRAQEKQKVLQLEAGMRLLLNLFTEQLESYRQRVLGDGFKLGQITLELNNTNEESKNKNIIIEKLQTEIRTLSETLSETQNGFQNYREETEEKLKSLAETIEVKCNEIEVHSSAATQANKELQLLTASLEERGRELEVKTSALIEEKEARAKIESDLVNQKRKFENEVDTLRAQEKQKVLQLEAGMRAKEEEHSRELADFLKKKTELEREKNALQDYINGLEQRINSIEVASKTKPPIFQLEPDENAVDWELSFGRGFNPSQNSMTEEDAMMLHEAVNCSSEPSCDSLCFRLLPQPATPQKGYFDWASEMRSSREASPTPAAIQRARDAPFTAADQLTSSVEELLKLTKTSKQARPDTPLMGQAAGRNDAAAALWSEPTEKRYFAWESEMRSSRESSPTPAAIQRARDAPFTALQAQSQADQLALSAVTRAELPPPAKRARPGTPASNAATAGSTTTTKEWRFFKSKGSRNLNKKM